MSFKRLIKSISTVIVLAGIIFVVFYLRIQSEKKAKQGETGSVPVAEAAKKETKGTVTIGAEPAFIGELIIRVTAQGIVEADCQPGLNELIAEGVDVLLQHIDRVDLPFPVAQGAKIGHGQLIQIVDQAPEA